MLTHLDIENYALIDHLNIDFNPGFTVITGETGAGKSILIDALDLVLGKRADSQFLLNPERKCIVEATFSIKDYHLKPFFDESSLDYDDSAILRREVHPNGKSRAFINDTPVNLNLLRFFGDLLIDVHAQHATTSLQNPEFQLSVVDTFSGLENEVSRYQKLFTDLKSHKLQLKDLSEEENNARATLDYKNFLFEELNAAGLRTDEQAELEENQALLTHAEEIKNTIFQVSEILHDEDRGMLQQLSQAEASLSRIAAYHPALNSLAERIKSDLIDLRDVHLELSKLNDNIEYNHEQLIAIQQRLELIYRLQQKHHVNSSRELIQIAEKLEQELVGFTSLEQKIKEQEELVRLTDSELKEKADELTAKRKGAFAQLQKEIISMLVHMGMPEARFEIRHTSLEECTMAGKDRIEFYFNANEGHSLKPLADVASGGELSRVMLAIKSIVSRKKSLPTIIFDEIDNGLSGDVAGRVGEVMVLASSRMQVIAVTHLPQIAGKARHHYSVFKLSKNNIAFSTIKFLDQQERIAELAKMIGGREITEASLAAAKELLVQEP